MKLTLHQQVEGKQPGDTVTVDEDRGRFLLMHGYATAGENPPVEAHEGPDYLMADQRVDSDDGQPTKSAAKGDWVDYAVSRGMDRDEAEASTKGELTDLYG